MCIYLVFDVNGYVYIYPWKWLVLSDDFSKICLSVSVSSGNLPEDNNVKLIHHENIYENMELLTKDLLLFNVQQNKMEWEPFSSQFSVDNQLNEIIYKQRNDSAQIV